MCVYAEYPLVHIKGDFGSFAAVLHLSDSLRSIVLEFAKFVFGNYVVYM